MRSDAEMMELILDVAKRDSRVRAVGMEGSRLNLHAPKDRFQDYDITYLVTEMAPFLQDDAWLERFGQRIMMQKPEAMSLFPPSLGGWFSYLMLFTDGNRIDLKLVPVSDLDAYLEWDCLLTILLDKDGLVKTPPIPSDSRYRTGIPSPKEFDDCCNEFWWVSTYVAKGLCRGEFLYATEHLGGYVRPSLLRMMAWKAAAEQNGPISAGKAYKYLDRFVSEEAWRKLQKTFQNQSTPAVWRSLFGCCDLFREVSKELSHLLGYGYPDYDQSVLAYLNKLYNNI